MTLIAHQYDQIATQYAAFYIQRKLTYDAVRTQHIENHSLTQNAKYCDICGKPFPARKYSILA